MLMHRNIVEVTGFLIHLRTAVRSFEKVRASQIFNPSRLLGGSA
jgi:hypothetical protein